MLDYDDPKLILEPVFSWVVLRRLFWVDAEF